MNICCLVPFGHKRNSRRENFGAFLDRRRKKSIFPVITFCKYLSIINFYISSKINLSPKDPFNFDLYLQRSGRACRDQSIKGKSHLPLHLQK